MEEDLGEVDVWFGGGGGGSDKGYKDVLELPGLINGPNEVVCTFALGR